MPRQRQTVIALSGLWLLYELTPACVGQGCAEATLVATSLPPSSSLLSLSSPTLLPLLLIYPISVSLLPPCPSVPYLSVLFSPSSLLSPPLFLSFLPPLPFLLSFYAIAP